MLIASFKEPESRNAGFCADQRIQSHSYKVLPAVMQLLGYGYGLLCLSSYHLMETCK